MTRRKAVSLIVVLGVALLLGAGAWFLFHHPDAPSDKPEIEFITVEAVYPGADAKIVADTVAAPIEQEVNGVEGMIYMVSRSANDGTYRLQIAFQPGTDLNVAQVLVQNRVALAQPKLPDMVNMQGISTKKRHPDILALVTLAAKNGRYSELELSDYANRKIKDELAHVDGVADVALIGPHANGANRDGFAILNGAPIVALVLWPIRAGHAKEVSAAVEESLAKLREKLPEGMVLERSFDFAPILEGATEATTPDYLIVDVQMPDAASSEQTRNVLHRCEEMLLKTPGVKDVLSLSENPFDLSNERACQVVRLDPNDKPLQQALIASIRDRFHQEIAEAAVQLRDLFGPRRFPSCAYPIDLAVYDTKDLGLPDLQQAAENLARRMGESPKLADAMARFRASGPQLLLEIDRDRAAKLDVSMDELLKALQKVLGPVQFNAFDPVNRTQQVSVPGGVREQAEQLKLLMVRNKQGELVPLTKLAKVNEVSGPRAIMRFNMYPMAEITANPASGVSLAEAREECERLARETLADAYRVGWLSQLPTSR